MLSPYHFLTHAQSLPPSRTRSTLLRLILNTSYDSERYPLDLAEVIALPAYERTLSFGFLSWCAAYPHEYTGNSDHLFDDLRNEVDSTKTGVRKQMGGRRQ